MLLLLLACAGSRSDTGASDLPTSVEGCLDAFPAEGEWSYENDTEWFRTSPDQVQETYCAIDDRACEPGNIISRRAAQCIARVDGLGGGLSTDYDLHYNGHHETLLWRVERHTWGDPNTGDWGGVYMNIDAWDGVFVEMADWEASAGGCL